MKNAKKLICTVVVALMTSPNEMENQITVELING